MTDEQRMDILMETPLSEVMSEEFKEYLQIAGFFRAPASTKYHGAYEGGLFDHSLAVMKALCIFTDDNDLLWEREASPYIVGMFHDLCKIDQYRHPELAGALDGKKVYGNDWEYNPNTLFKGHGDKSLMLLSQHIVLTEEEALCIRYHMGAFVPKEEWGDYTAAVHKYENVLWTHHADMLASHVVGI